MTSSILDQFSGRALVHTHRFRYHPLVTTHLTQGVEKRMPIFITCHVAQHLETALAWRKSLGVPTHHVKPIDKLLARTALAFCVDIREPG